MRHSVGGSDYGSVRVGAFMVRALLRPSSQPQMTPQNGLFTVDKENSGRLSFCLCSPPQGRRILSQELPAIAKPGFWLTELSPHEFDRREAAKQRCRRRRQCFLSAPPLSPRSLVPPPPRPRHRYSTVVFPRAGPSRRCCRKRFPGRISLKSSGRTTTQSPPWTRQSAQRKEQWPIPTPFHRLAWSRDSRASVVAIKRLTRGRSERPQR